MGGTWPNSADIEAAHTLMGPYEKGTPIPPLFLCADARAMASF